MVGEGVTVGVLVRVGVDVGAAVSVAEAVDVCEGVGRDVRVLVTTGVGAETSGTAVDGDQLQAVRRSREPSKLRVRITISIPAL